MLASVSDGDPGTVEVILEYKPDIEAKDEVFF
jgi:hypothetical protein